MSIGRLQQTTNSGNGGISLYLPNLTNFAQGLFQKQSYQQTHAKASMGRGLNLQLRIESEAH